MKREFKAWERISSPTLYSRLQVGFNVAYQVTVILIIIHLIADSFAELAAT